jgi:hypothetical protein
MDAPACPTLLMTDALDVGAVPVADWPREVDEPVELLIVHMNYHFAKGADKERWREWCPGRWTDFNGGGWVWNGLCGMVVAVRPPRSADGWWS